MLERHYRGLALVDKPGDGLDEFALARPCFGHRPGRACQLRIGHSSVVIVTAAATDQGCESGNQRQIFQHQSWLSMLSLQFTVGFLVEGKP